MIDKPAFPVENYSFAEQGMSLRDYFAAKAMQAWESRQDLDDLTDFSKAKRCYEMADAMLQARINAAMKRDGIT
jgi:hypothetical protein